jgi:hypothetical protein
MGMMRWIVMLSVVAATLSAGAATDNSATPLFNGKDFTGWKLFLPDENAKPEATWSAQDGVVRCTGEPAGYMRTEKAYENYRLRLEWRWVGEGGNSGVLLHCQDPDTVWPKAIESQLQSGHAGDYWVIGGADFKEHTDKDNRRVIKKEQSSEKPLGEWNQYEIVCQGNTIQSYVNGVLQNAATECTLTKGYIGLQSEGTPIEFRNITLELLGK